MNNNLGSNVLSSQVLDDIKSIRTNAIKMKEQCMSFRSLLDEGTYKIDSLLNIVNNLKIKEKVIMESGDDQAVIQQITEEQINSFLEMLKTPAFQSIIKQLLYKWVNTGNISEKNNE